MRHAIIAAVTLAAITPMGCANSLDRGCLDRDLDSWCYHELVEQEGGVAPSEACRSPTPSTQAVLSPNGRFLVDSSSGGFSGVTHYFDAESEEHVSARHWTDVNTYCGGFSFWYGRRVDIN